MRPTPEQNASYRECLQFDRQRAAERGAGCSGLLSGEDAAAHARHYEIVEAALGAGVIFGLSQ